MPRRPLATDASSNEARAVEEKLDESAILTKTTEADLLVPISEDELRDYRRTRRSLYPKTHHEDFPSEEARVD